MKRKIISIIVVVIILGFSFTLYGFLTYSPETPPPYEFFWELGIIEENNTTVIIEIQNILLLAHHNHTYINITKITSIPLSSLLTLSNKGTPVSYPFMDSPVTYVDGDQNGVISCGDLIKINKTEFGMNDYLNLSLLTVTKYPWERLEFKFGVFGSDVADAKVPPPFVKVNQEIIKMIYDDEEHTWQSGGDISYYVWSIEDIKHLQRI